MKQLLSGNEAVALGAYHAGVRVATAYPGTPSTEILEHFARYPGVYAEWGPNEKVALDVAIGAAYVGASALCAMKHVGLNVAADSLFYASMTGVPGALVIVTADDPGMHSSQNEQDNRNFGKFARLPVLEPSDSQEAYEFVQQALALSHQFETPALLRMTTRVCHSYAPVDVPEGEAALPPAPCPLPPAPCSLPPAPCHWNRDIPRFVMVPGNARRRHPVIEQRVRDLAEWAETTPLNRVEPGDRAVGIITGGIAYPYAKEVLPHASYLKLGLSYPLPRRKIQAFAASVDQVLVIEDLDPFWEEQVRLMGVACRGKLGEELFPPCGEFSPDVVRAGLVKAGILPLPAPLPDVTAQLPPLPPRPPVLCPGCPHRGVFHVLKKLKTVVFGDIGCYTLGVTPPLSAVDTCGCMGAGVGQLHGAKKAGLADKAVAIIGDSTFFHTGLPAVVNSAYNQGADLVILMDNRVTAMTGHQDHPGTGRTLQGAETIAVDPADVARSLGIRHVTVVDPNDLAATEAAVRAGLEAGEPAVVVTRRPCALRVPREPALVIDPARCNGCGLCLRIGCPAVYRVSETEARIDPLLCTGCTVCQQVCARKAIAPASV